MSNDLILKKLSDWVYNNEDRLVLSDEFWASEDFQEPELIDAWFDAQIEGEISDEDYDMLDSSFLSFASTEEGGEYYLWKYEGINENNAPVIYLGSSGEYDMVAPSLNSFICMLAHGKTFSANSETLRVTWNDVNDQKYISDTKKFLASFDGLIECMTLEESIQEMSQHKSIVTMVNNFIEKYKGT